MARAKDEEIVKTYKEYFLRPSPFIPPSVLDTPSLFEDEMGQQEREDEMEDEEEQIDDGLTVVDRLANCYRPDIPLKNMANGSESSYLFKIYPPLEHISNPVVSPPNTTEFNDRPYARAILRSLPNLSREANEIEGYPSLIYHFAKACLQSPNRLYNGPALLFLLPDFASKMAEREAVVKSLTNTDIAEEERSK
ncbi:hypothetical protein PMAYCL1PPCAC_12333 [Pristionchus mayeri]|uniref:Uncharacterized protein n=1 Tax=Pristionchus mayeri TaxID=1317129 RepID=A0AAN5C8Y1_9BILA|nr:hypothetical protein PMAYCL1PPCAC_12333 [Pristionchus mayeri]